MYEPKSPESGDLKALWRNQPQEGAHLPAPDLIQRRSIELSAITRAEISSTVGAALFFTLVIALRPGSHRVVGITVALVAAWILITLVWRRAARKDPKPLASSGLDFYRNELEQRRRHLRNEWLWHGPLLLACITLIAVAIGSFTPSLRRVLQVSPLVIALVVWTGIGFRRRWREAEEVRRELEELAKI